MTDDIVSLPVPDSRQACPCSWETPSDTGYHSYYSLGFAIDELIAGFPGRAEKLSIGRSYEGRELWAIRISPDSAVARKRVLLVGCHHAAEWISVELPVQIMKSILNGTAGIPQSVIDDVEFWAVPMLNPDGHVFSANYRREWRKSRAPALDVAQILTFGIDLNRNYPVGFGTGVTSQSPETDMYCGPAPFSEPETSSLRDLCLAKRFQGILSFHAYGREILYPWAHISSENSGPEIAPLKAAAEAMAGSIGRAGGAYVAKQAYYHYSEGVGGDFCDWAFQTFGALALTVEAGPPDDEMRLPSTEIGATFNEFRSGFSTFVSLL